MKATFLGMLFIVASIASKAGGPDRTTVTMAAFCDRVTTLLGDQPGNWTVSTRRVIGQRFFVTWCPLDEPPKSKGSRTLLPYEVRVDVVSEETKAAAVEMFEMRIRGAGIGPNVRSKELGDEVAGWEKPAERGPSLILLRQGSSLVTISAPNSEVAWQFAKAVAASDEILDPK